MRVYVEPSYGKFVNELETKVILQKNFLDDRLVLGYNLTLAPEWEKKSGDSAADPASPNSGREPRRSPSSCTRSASPTVSRPDGPRRLEVRNHHEYAGHSLKSSNREFTAWNAGPTVHYANKSWWVTATWLPQLKAGHCYTADQCAETSNHRNLNDLDAQRISIPRRHPVLTI